MKTNELLSSIANYRLSKQAMSLVSAGLFVVVQLFSPTSVDSQEIVLRDFSVIDSSVKTFDIDGVTLENGQHLNWWNIHSADVDAARREQFEAMRNEIGIGLLRLRQRIVSRDFSNLTSPAKILLQQCGEKPSNTARFAAAALCRGEIADQNREAACLALLKMLSIEHKLIQANVDRWTDLLPVEINSESHICDLLIPIWFDQIQAKATWQEIQRLKLDEDDAGTTFRIYVASMAIAADAQKEVGLLTSSADLKDSQWVKLLQAQQSIAKGEYETVVQSLPNEFERIESPLACATLYYRGIAGLEVEDPERRQAALLDLLQIPASLGKLYPEFAAASLFRVIRSDLLTDKPDSVASLRRELLQTYPRTVHARQLQQPDNSVTPGKAP